MTPSRSDAYRQAGVDLTAAEEVVRRLKPLAGQTATPAVVTPLGGFGGCFAFPDPQGPDLLVASIDGVGTKMKVSHLTGDYVSAGYDIVAHCVDDVLTQGARPLFFLDYIGTSRLEVARVEALAQGMVAACREAQCALLGGETAEMPGVYLSGETDLVGCLMGTVSRDQLLPGARVKPGDRLIGLDSLGLHTNGYSLARRILIDEGPGVEAPLFAGGPTIGEALGARHRMYWPAVRDLLGMPQLHAMAHITGGGIPGNLARVLPAGATARVATGAWDVPPIFREIERRGRVAREEMFAVFNMGIGWILVVAPEVADAWADRLAAAGWGGRLLGEIQAGGGGVELVA